ncbi:hypothetical protein [Denitratisoma oestradiolicum]|uniref:Uncharacterized protein n=1 Tax=Denitratisoma oestradiolicum TaxID=311182 RepID=A0A6S6Y0U6_9PROT|nr:hypothetical protein [Denitratisoma oestradiolicum]TWO80767.1 hypothetical protein CBW56_08360 [Denitratisoma oestradiolicum]CAB1370923.1 conserved protein of unknown function [Denitratisoma oestradiolicum]
MQLQLSHDPIEDRLLLRLDLDGQCYGFWLTRRVTILLWPVLWSMLEHGVIPGAGTEARRWLLAMDHEKARSGQEVQQAPPISLIAPVRLVVTIQHGHQADGRHVLGLFDGSGAGETMTLDDDGLHALIRLLHETVPKAGWDIPLSLPQSGLTPASVGTSLRH